MRGNPVEDLETIFQAGVDKVDPYRIIVEQLSVEGDTLTINTGSMTKQYDLARFSDIVVLGAGKAAAKMAKALEDVLSSRITRGLISVKKGHSLKLRVIESIEAGHPIPDQHSVKAAAQMLKIIENSSTKSLFINLISGGGSALLSFPIKAVPAGSRGELSVTLKEKQTTTDLLLRCGATIGEMNTVRKHLSSIKGGRLARALYPRTSINLILSDVVGDPLDTIASGLFYPDSSSYKDCLAILKNYELVDKLPESVVRLLRAGARGLVPETPKPGEACFEATTNFLIGSNLSALVAAGEKAESMGYEILLLGSMMTGEARELAKFLYGLARSIRDRGVPRKGPLCVLCGGETTVTIRGQGVGGRNQEMALSFLWELARDPRKGDGIYFLSAATDGNDGPTDSAGGFAWKKVWERGQRKDLDIRLFLKENDSYHFLEQTNAHLKTGPTNTNVCDLQVLIVA